MSHIARVKTSISDLQLVRDALASIDTNNVLIYEENARCRLYSGSDARICELVIKHPASPYDMGLKFDTKDQTYTLIGDDGIVGNYCWIENNPLRQVLGRNLQKFNQAYAVKLAENSLRYKMVRSTSVQMDNGWLRQEVEVRN